MRRVGELVVIAFALLVQPVAGQTAGGDVIGFFRSDGLVMPEFAFVDGAWREAWQPDYAAQLASVSEYTWFDSLGVAHVVSTTGAAAACCGDRVGHQTDFPDAFTTDAFFEPTPVIGYVTSNPVRQAVFLPSARRPDMTVVAAMLDSVSVVPDSIATQIQVHTWEAELQGERYVFFQAQRVPRGRYYQQACALVAGSIGASPQDLYRVARGGNDCDGRGESQWLPQAVIARGNELFLLVERSDPQVWTRANDLSWQFHLGVTRENCC